MTACIPVLLAGGASSRLAPIVTHKPFFPVFGRPLIFYILDRLKAAGFSDAIFIVNNEDETTARSLAYPDFKLNIVVQGKQGGMAGAILSVEAAINNRPIFVVNAVELISSSFLTELVAQFSDSMVLVGRRVEGYFPGGYFILENGRAVGLIEKPGAGNEPSDLVNVVLHYFPRPSEFLTTLKDILTTTDDWYEQALTRLMSTQRALVIPYEDYWLPVKYPWHLLNSVSFLLKNELPKSQEVATIAPTAVIEGLVYFGHGVVIGHHAVIKGPVYLGDGVRIGDNTLIRESCIEAGATIGFGSEIARSYVGAHSETHTAFIGDSILEGKNWFAAGSKTANLRFDKQTIMGLVKGEKIDTGRTKLGTIAGSGAVIGINASLMPGVCLAAKCIIKPGEVVYESK